MAHLAVHFGILQSNQIRPKQSQTRQKGYCRWKVFFECGKNAVNAKTETKVKDRFQYEIDGKSGRRRRRRTRRSRNVKGNKTKNKVNEVRINDWNVKM